MIVKKAERIVPELWLEEGNFGRPPVFVTYAQRRARIINLGLCISLAVLYGLVFYFTLDELGAFDRPGLRPPIAASIKAR